MAEKSVMDRLKRAFGPDDKGVIYYRFPVRDKAGKRFDKEPDFTILHPDFGLVVVECKGYKIDHIDSIEGQQWQLKNINQKHAAPYSQAREQAFFLNRYFMGEERLRDDRGNTKVPLNFFIALPNISSDEWENRGFDGLPSVRAILSDEMGQQSLREIFFDTPGKSLSPTEYQAARAALSGGEVISGKRLPTSNGETKGELYEEVEYGLNRLDRRQEEVGLQIPNGEQQIRGIAGSGKTILLGMKAAAMHAAHPEWKIAITFNTRSLYDNIRSTVERFTQHFTDQDPDWERLDVLHAWGGKSEHGLYYKIAQSAGISPNTVNDARSKFGFGSPAYLLNKSCEELLNIGGIQEEYDAILIDEAQDLRPSFFNMCHAALKPVGNGQEPDRKRLIWAYDEAQNLSSLSAPTPKEIFGTDDDGDPVVDLRGSYGGGILKSQIMRKAYRSPREILMTAHVLGMGLKSPSGAVQAITRKENWSDIGYNLVSGDFRETGTPIKITRPLENSPHPLAESSKAQPFMKFKSFDEKSEEISHVTEAVYNDINDQGLNPEQILIICLGSPTKAKKIGQKVEKSLSKESIPSNPAWAGNASVFKKEGEVTISRINRAKGNEAAMVYVVGLEEVVNSEWYDSDITPRNEAFVAITRTRAWCEVTGTGNSPIFTEIRQIIDSVSEEEPIVEFPAPPRDVQGPYDDDTMATTIQQFTTEQDSEGKEISCPVDECGFNGTVPTVVLHVNGTSDLNHQWPQLGYEGAAEFRREHGDL
ncbi:DEAD/DEAH box helicase [Halanaeroarchaeum sp. HSR-CO]|uniref:DEAD/DEAH box helicase n=1 Tax=Halanaeroarchaeum sp. HSR-CO TaxID=2866382 RepID=UPI00217D4481|nr:nuclease-related domain-containing DEAD/DEAH box helicase [Halanaeroarchaeum sp. HSR-CO]